MKTLLLIIAILITIVGQTQTIAYGTIKSQDKYSSEVLHEKEWMEWDIWAFQGRYDIKAKKEDTIKARFITCRDTTELIVHGVKKRQKIELDIKLDGQIITIK